MYKFTFHSNSTLTLMCVSAEAPSHYSLTELAQLSGVHPAMLLYYQRLGLIAAQSTGAGIEPAFAGEALDEVRRIEHYRRHFGVSRRALPLLCELRREGERRHLELRFMDCP
jgi:DNA-binding transcriptional MerR regulator